MKYIQSIRRMGRHNPYVAALGMLIVCACILRTYNLSSFVTFLGDQGRDAIIMMRIVTLDHFPAVGPPSSIGMIYLGPFYYYFMAPWLLLTGFNPIGPALGVAILSSIGMGLVFVAVERILDSRTALITTALMTFSGTLVLLSRFSWNPNLLPLFALIAVLLVIEAGARRSMWWYAASGIAFALCTQLHYLSLAAALPIGLLLLYFAYKQSRPLVQKFSGLVAYSAGCVLVSIPLIIFDVRHDFLNVTNLLRLLREGTASSGDSVLQSFLLANKDFMSFAIGYDISSAVSAVLLLIIICSLYVWRHNGRYVAIGGTFIATLAMTSLFTAQRHPHYFGFLYGLFYVVLAYIVARMSQRGSWIFVPLCIVIFVLAQVNDYSFFWREGGNQIQKAEHIAKVIFDNSTESTIQVTSIPDTYGDSVQRYFLELWGKRPLAKDSQERAEEMFVMCESACHPIGNPQWDIAFFAATKIVGVWKTENVRIYRLVRE